MVFPYLDGLLLELPFNAWSIFLLIYILVFIIVAKDEWLVLLGQICL